MTLRPIATASVELLRDLPAFRRRLTPQTDMAEYSSPSSPSAPSRLPTEVNL